MNDFVRINKDTYNRIAKHFSATRDFYWDLEPLVRYVKQGDRVLDLGCGDGRLYKVLEPIGVSYVGFDQSEEMLKIARERFANISFVAGDMRELPFEDNAFDVLFCMRTFHHLSDVQSRMQALHEMFRSLTPGGTVIMSNWNLHSNFAKQKIERGEMTMLNERDFIVPWKNSEGIVLAERWYHGFDDGELRELFQTTGFTIEDQYYVSNDKRSTIENGEGIMSILKKTR